MPLGQVEAKYQNITYLSVFVRKLAIHQSKAEQIIKKSKISQGTTYEDPVKVLRANIAPIWSHTFMKKVQGA